MDKKLYDEVYKELVQKGKDKCIDKDYLEDSLKYSYDGLDIEINDISKYDWKVNLTFKLPPFIPCIDEDTGELWYVSTKEKVDLRYKIQDNKYIFRTNDTLIYNALQEIEKELKQQKEEES